jgi:iron complex outermembrane receptor protein
MLGSHALAESESNSTLSSFEKAELKKLLELDFRELGGVPIRSVLGYDQEHWRNPASVHVIRPEDVSLNGHVLMVDSFRNVAGMYVTRGVGYDDFVTMRNFSGSATEKFLTIVDGREVLQRMGGTINWTTEDVPLAILDRVEIIRGAGASIWGTNAVSGVVNVVTKHAAATQGNSVRLIMQDDGTFLGEYVHGGMLSDDSFYRVWVRDQEYAEGELMSGLPARDDGYARKAGFRYDKSLGPDLDFTFAGGFATRRVDHVMDLTARLFYKNFDPVTIPGEPPLIPAVNIPGLMSTTNWPTETVSSMKLPTGFSRFQNYEEMPQDGSHLRAKLSGITENDLEWSLSGYAELYDTSLGHIGHSWERKEYDLDFRANKPIGDKHHLSFGASFRHMSFDVNDVVTSPWAFPTFDLETNSSSSAIPVLDYGTSPTKFDRFSGFLQDSINLSDDLVLSIGSKFEDGDLSGSNFQPGLRVSYSIDEQNIFWGAYSRAYRQASLVEQYTKVSYARFWDPSTSQWINQSFSGNPANHDEKMDAYELGWRTRPSADLLIELSLYHYNTKDAVFSGPPIYSLSDVKTTGGEITFDYRASDTWHLKGGYAYSKGKKDGEVQDDFPESMANLTSHINLRDNLLFSQNLYYTDDRIIPSAYNEISIDDYLRLDLGLIWRLKEDWEVGFFGRDLLDPGHPENMYNDLDVEPGKVERTFLLSITKEF